MLTRTFHKWIPLFATGLIGGQLPKNGILGYWDFQAGPHSVKRTSRDLAVRERSAVTWSSADF
jgi:hypothetical protein